MNKYNYYEAVFDDVVEYLKENQERIQELIQEEGEERAKSELYDELFIVDSVTGNASGSYFFNAWKAEEAITHNLDLLSEATEEFGDDLSKELARGAETCDVIIRCYIVGAELERAFEEVFGDYNEGLENKED